MESKVVLAVTTLNYEKKCVDGLLQLADQRIFYGYAIPDCCLIPHSRNKAINMAYENCPEFTHLLFIDDDMCGFQAPHVLKLVENTNTINDCHVCSALVTQRNPPYKMVATFGNLNDNEVLEAIKAGEVIESSHVGMAFTLIKREVLDATREETEESPIWFTLDRLPRAGYEFELKDYIDDLMKRMDNDNITIRDALYKSAAFGENSFRGSKLIGEDIEFCRKIQKLGFNTYVDCGVVVGHLGLVGFDFRHALLEAYNKQHSIDSID